MNNIEKKTNSNYFTQGIVNNTKIVKPYIGCHSNDTIRSAIIYVTPVALSAPKLVMG